MEFRKMVTMTLCVRQQKRQIWRRDFWTLWEKTRVERFERTVLKYVYFHMRNRWPVQVRCMKQDTQSRYTGTTHRDRMGWGGRWERGLGCRTHVVGLIDSWGRSSIYTAGARPILSFSWSKTEKFSLRKISPRTQVSSSSMRSVFTWNLL